jgi:hypothetical protein
MMAGSSRRTASSGAPLPDMTPSLGFQVFDRTQRRCSVAVHDLRSRRVSAVVVVKDDAGKESRTPTRPFVRSVVRSSVAAHRHARISPSTTTTAAAAAAATRTALATGYGQPHSRKPSDPSCGESCSKNSPTSVTADPTTRACFGTTFAAGSQSMQRERKQKTRNGQAPRPGGSDRGGRLGLGLASNQQLALEDTVSFEDIQVKLPSRIQLQVLLVTGFCRVVQSCQVPRGNWHVVPFWATKAPQQRTDTIAVPTLREQRAGAGPDEAEHDVERAALGGHVQRAGSVVGVHLEGLGTGAGEELDHLPRRVLGGQVQRE